MKNLILTQKGERLYQPDFGTDIQRSLFENNTKELILELQESLNEDIKFYSQEYIENSTKTKIVQSNQIEFNVHLSSWLKEPNFKKLYFKIGDAE